ncbi:hypothetical protein SHKM778_96060 (plasmid) [Streptomyces sp. KM77-8]|uniref:Uncharacterized protein n=1 Tax=Streptomyces haneummycinicus TaxID=3074435 RepID=A0AAT9I0E3_9ACTN
MPLLAGARTGYMHPKCYAAASRDCSEKISQEHWLSADVLRGMTNGKTITVLGMPWQKGSTHQLPVSALAANILCQRHNSALSPLDVSASSAFRVLWHFQEDQRRVPDPHGAEFALVNGDELERWLLKLLWGPWLPVPSATKEIRCERCTAARARRHCWTTCFGTEPCRKGGADVPLRAARLDPNSRPHPRPGRMPGGRPVTASLRATHQGPRPHTEGPADGA